MILLILVQMGRGVESLKTNIFTAKTRVSKGTKDQALRHQCEFRNLAIFYNAKKFPKIYYLLKVG